MQKSEMQIVLKFIYKMNLLQCRHVPIFAVTYMLFWAETHLGIFVHCKSSLLFLRELFKCMLSIIVLRVIVNMYALVYVNWKTEKRITPLFWDQKKSLCQQSIFEQFLVTILTDYDQNETRFFKLCLRWSKLLEKKSGSFVLISCNWKKFSRLVSWRFCFSSFCGSHLGAQSHMVCRTLYCLQEFRLQLLTNPP